MCVKDTRGFLLTLKCSTFDIRHSTWLLDSPLFFTLATLHLPSLHCTTYNIQCTMYKEQNTHKISFDSDSFLLPENTGGKSILTVAKLCELEAWERRRRRKCKVNIRATLDCHSSPSSFSFSSFASNTKTKNDRLSLSHFISDCRLSMFYSCCCCFVLISSPLAHMIFFQFHFDSVCVVLCCAFKS